MGGLCNLICSRGNKENTGAAPVVVFALISLVFLKYFVDSVIIINKPCQGLSFIKFLEYT